MTGTEKVLAGESRWHAEAADCLEYLRGLPEGSVDLIFTSPPYADQRLYLENGKNLGLARKTDEWVAWLVEGWRECARVCKGLVAFVVAGKTKDYRWSAGPALLMAELHRAGFNLRNPPIFRRAGIPGSGGPDWLKADYEWIVCTSRPGKLPWSDNCAMGKPPKWAPGGAMSYRDAEGKRKNERGYTAKPRLGRNMANGQPGTTKGTPRGRRVTRGVVAANGDTVQEDAYLPPELSNPGNVIQLVVGGGVMGNKICHQNEAPFPEDLAAFFVRSFCQPGGVVLDPFAGSGTTLAVAVRWGRRALGVDIRTSQVELVNRRLATETPLLPIFTGPTKE